MNWTPQQFFAQIIIESGNALRPIIGIPRTVASDRLMLAIAIQESGLRSRYQVLPGGELGHGRGWWQFEYAGVRGVMFHPATCERARRLCEVCHVQWQTADVWRAIEGHDLLATGFARLLLWSDPEPLPTLETPAWDYYLRCWRPGKPDRERWTTSWAASEIH